MGNKLIKLNFITIIFSLFIINGCVSFSKDAGFSDVVDSVKKRGGQTPSMHNSESFNSDIQNVLSQPLGVDDAVQIALINNPGLQAALSELKISEADLVQAGKLSNPSLTYARFNRLDDEYNIERLILFDIVSLFTMPLKVDIECRRFQQAKLKAVTDVLGLSAEVKKSYYSILAAKQTVYYLEKITGVAEASMELARGMAQTGNLSKLQYAREQAFYAEVMSQLASAKLMAFNEQEHLTRLMGMWGENVHLILPEQLPELPKSIRIISEIEKTALLNRLDILAMKKDVQSKAKALGLNKATGLINVLEMGYANNTGKNIPRQHGYEISLQVPIFDWGDAKIAKSKAVYMQSVWNLHDLAINARSEVRVAYHDYQALYEVAKHYHYEIVPLRKFILDQNMLHYNGMLVSTFELLADAREYISSTNTYIQTLRDFWVADIDLQTALMVRSPNNKS
jgi:outer membrane protein TolC